MAKKEKKEKKEKKDKNKSGSDGKSDGRQKKVTEYIAACGDYDTVEKLLVTVR